MNIYNEQEIQELKSEYLRLMKFIEQNQWICDSEIYRDKYERACQIYEIIHDL